MARKNAVAFNLTFWEIVLIIGIVIFIFAGGWSWFNFSGIHEIDKVTPVELMDVDTETSAVEKEESFEIEILVDHTEDSEILAFTINGIKFDEFVKSQTELGLYIVEVDATDLIGTQLYEVQKIHYQVDSEDKTLSVIETEGITSSVNMTQTHNEPRFVGVSAAQNTAVGTAVAITIEFDDPEGITEVVIGGVTYDSETDFNVVDNAESIEISLAGLSVGEYEKVLESYTFNTGTQSVRVDLTANNAMTFDVVKAEPQLVSIVPSDASYTVAEIDAGSGTYNLVITMDEVDDLYSVTINETKYILATHNDVTDVNTVNDTITISMEQTDNTVGTHSFELTEFEYFDSLVMQDVVLTESNVYSITVAAS